MTGNEWQNFGEEIRKTVQDAVKNQDYHKLNQTVTETLDRAMGAALSYGTHQRTNAVRPGYQNVRSQMPAASNLYKRTDGIQAIGWVFTILGGLCGGGSAVFAILMLFGGMIAGSILSEFGVAATVFAIPAAAFLGMMCYGISLCRLEKQFRTLVRGLGTREYCNVKELAAMIAKSEKETLKALRRMTIKKWFRQGHFDESKKCFITSDRMYQEYMRINGQRKAEAAKLEAKRQEEVKRAEDMNSKLSPEARKVIETGDSFVRKIRACNDAIPGEEISAKISHMELIVDRIFDRVEQDPASISDIRKLMDYYLPTTIKLLEAYQELDAQPVAGENIQSSKREIEATLDTLNAAFEKILDDLFHHTAWDVSSDISVLNTVLAQEGLKDDGMKL